LSKRLGDQILINLIAGALGGVGVGKSSPSFDLGMIGNIISGLIGGGVLGQIVNLLLPAITAAAYPEGIDHGSYVGSMTRNLRKNAPLVLGPLTY
jgi:uncharacterized membrane protein YeaQ/YmgE (transglycosylase-associated protein family)